MFDMVPNTPVMWNQTSSRVHSEHWTEFLEFIYLIFFGKSPPKIFWTLLNGVDETPVIVNFSSNALFQN